MRVETFDYELRPSSIAQHPSPERGAARLLVLPAEGGFLHRRVADLPRILPHRALIVLNDTRVVPARLVGRKTGTGGKTEILLLERLDSGDAPRQRWRAVGRASKGLAVGATIDCEEVRARVLTPRSPGGIFEVELTSDGGPLVEALRRVGHTPLPPYIRRADEVVDRERYQTVFARVDGAVAAPTAGLHFTNDLLEQLRIAGFRIATVTLHVGLGTFQPVTEPDLDDHAMHEE